IQVADSQRQTASKQFQVTVATNAPSLQLSAVKLVFNGAPGGDAPSPQNVAILATGANPVSFAIQIDGGIPNTPPPAWLKLRLINGVTPSRVSVSIDTTGMAAGTFMGRFRTTVPRDPTQAPTDVSVTLVLTDAPPKLDVSPSLVRAMARAA